MASETKGDVKDDVEKFFRTVPASSPSGLGGDVDVFSGVTIRPHHLLGVDRETFSRQLPLALATWEQEGKRGIWIKVPTEQAELIPVATNLGFDFHHAQAGYVMLTKWLPNSEPNKLPNYAHHYVGVAGFVLNDKDELLVIQEKYLLSLKRPIWKLPGGLADRGENLSETAIREVKEETGIDTEFVSLLCLRHMHEFRWGTDDLYFVCVLRPLTTDIKMDDSEVAACKWINLMEYISDPNTIESNRLIAESFLECRKHGLSYQAISYPHFIKTKPNLVHYSLKPTIMDRPVTDETTTNTKPRL